MALLYLTRGLFPLHPTPSWQNKAYLTNNLSLKGYRNSTGLGKSGSPTSKKRRRRLSRSFDTPTPPRITSARPTPPFTSMGSCTTETPYGQRHPGAAPRFHHQALSRRTSSSIPSPDSWKTWRPLQPTTRLFLDSLSPIRPPSILQSRCFCKS